MSSEILNPRFVIAYTIILGFAAAYMNDPSETMTGALIGAFAGAWGYYLGSSNASSEKSSQVTKALDLAQASAPPAVPDITLEPGESKTVTAEPTKE